MNAAEYGRTLHGLSLNVIVRDLAPSSDLLGFDPDAVERAVREYGAVLLPTAVRESHGWRDCVVADPDGYTFAIGQAL